ncbi:MAG: ABC-2 transporter permease [Lachnospiraceae bacterium]|nr:ABC-2 transporter permease [Lachnospiraceae bacterium]
MKGLILKDFYCLKKYMKQLVMILICLGVWGIMMKSSTYILFMISMFASMTVLTTMAYDEKSQVNKYLLAGPTSRWEIVIGKFASWLVTITAAVAIELLLGFLMMNYYSTPGNDLLISILETNSVYIILFSILIPICYKIGVERARIMMFVIFLIPTAIIIFFANYSKADPVIIDALIQNMMILLPISAIIILAASIIISIQIVEKKEF